MSAMIFPPSTPLDMPKPANRLVIATAGQRHRHADSRSELNGPDRLCAVYLQPSTGSQFS